MDGRSVLARALLASAALLPFASLPLAGCNGSTEGIRYCAVHRTISCHGNPGPSEPICDETCAVTPGAESYDARTECLTMYGPEHGAGSSCEQALADLPAPGTLTIDRCAPASRDGACDSCVKASCCAELSACQADNACVSLFYCVAFCSDDACRDDCYLANRDGVDSMNAYFTCVDAECPNACAS